MQKINSEWLTTTKPKTKLGFDASLLPTQLFPIQLSRSMQKRTRRQKCVIYLTEGLYVQKLDTGQLVEDLLTLSNSFRLLFPIENTWRSRRLSMFSIRLILLLYSVRSFILVSLSSPSMTSILLKDRSERYKMCPIIWLASKPG